MIFNDNGNITTIELEHEPVGYDAIDYNLNQDDDRYGRDWLFLGNGLVTLELTAHSNYAAFVKFEELYEKHGFEASIKFKVTDGQESFIGSVDLLDVEYNGHDVFKFSVLQEAEEGLIKKRADLVVDLFSDKDLDGNPSTPAPSKFMLLPAKQIYRESVWENVGGSERNVVAGSGPTIRMFNYSSGTTKSSIKNTLSFIRTGTSSDGWNFKNEFKFIDAKTDILNTVIEIDYGNSKIEPYLDSNNLEVFLNIRKGFPANNINDWNAGDIRMLDKVYMNNGVSYFNNKTIKLSDIFENSIIQTGEVIHIWFQWMGGVGWFNYNNIKFTIKAYEETFDVVTRSVNLYDATKKVIKDISGMDVVFPIAQTGELKNHYIFSGNMVRNIDKPFLLSFENLQKWFPEINLDYEIMSDKRIYIGRREDYYTDNEIDVIDNVAFDSYNETQNKRYSLNKFTFKYNKYQSQKENTEENTNDIVHGEAEYHVQNIQVESLKSVEVDFVRDPFMLQETINKALTENVEKATQEDNTIFIIDAVNMSDSDYNRTKTSMLFHRRIDGKIQLSNDGNFRWDLLGIEPGSTFEITSHENKGVYNVDSVDSTNLVLIKYSGNSYPNPFEGDERFTSFKYVVKGKYKTLKPFFYANSGALFVGNINGVNSPETFANLKYSIGLNIRRFWRDFISTAVKTSKEPKQIKYINNTNYFNGYFVPFHKEDDDIKVSTPILDTKVVTTTLIMPFEQYLRICKILRSQDRGFIRTFNPKAEPIYLYPTNMKAVCKTSRLKEVTVTGELKNIPKTINITKTGSFYNIWIHKFETFMLKINGDYLIFQDSNGVAFYRKSHYSEIKVNGINYNSSQEVLNAVNNL